MRTCLKFTFANKIEAMHQRSLVSVKVEPRSACRLSSALFSLASILFKRLKFTCVNGLLLGVTVHEFMLISICQCLCHNPLTCVAKNASVEINL